MATVQEKPPTKKRTPKTNSSTRKEKFIRFDDPNLVIPGDEYHEDGAPTTSLKVIMTIVVVLPLMVMAGLIWSSWQYGFMGWLYVGLLRWLSSPVLSL